MQALWGGIALRRQDSIVVFGEAFPFENDEEVSGKCVHLGEEDSSKLSILPVDKNRYLYFLPGGERYWCYGWTKGKLLVKTGTDSFANDYRVERRGEDLYMIINYKTIGYPQTGGTTPLVMRKVDSRRYSAKEIARKDAINKPFLTDKRVIGKWKKTDYYVFLREWEGENTSVS